MRNRTSEACDATSNPATEARPASKRSRVANTRTAVVLPAPLGPSRPQTVPVGTSRSSPSNATVEPYRLTKPDAEIAKSGTLYAITSTAYAMAR